MTKMSIVVALTEDGSQVVVETREDGKPLAHVIFDAPEVDTLLQNIAAARASLAEQVPDSLDPTFRIRAIEEPPWRVPDPLPDGRRMLALRHPGFGWLAFILGAERVEAIIAGLKSR